MREGRSSGGLQRCQPGRAPLLLPSGPFPSLSRPCWVRCTCLMASSRGSGLWVCSWGEGGWPAVGLPMEQGLGTFWREGSCLDAELESVLRPRTGLLPQPAALSLGRVNSRVLSRGPCGDGGGGLPCARHQHKHWTHITDGVGDTPAGATRTGCCVRPCVCKATHTRGPAAVASHWMTAEGRRGSRVPLVHA